MRGKFQGVCPGAGRILMSQPSGPSVTSLLPEKRRPGQEAAQSATAGVEGRSPRPPAPDRARDRARGWPGRSGLGQRGEAARGPGKLQAKEPTSPPLFLLPLGHQFPPQPETPLGARFACRWRCKDALGALLGVGGGALPQRGIRGLEGARAQKGTWAGGRRGTGRAGGGGGRQNLYAVFDPALPPE